MINCFIYTPDVIKNFISADYFWALYNQKLQHFKIIGCRVLDWTVTFFKAEFSKIDDTYIFISSKYPKSNEDVKKQKSVDYYDIQNIIAMATKNKHIYKNYKIFIVVPNKKKVLET